MSSTPLRRKNSTDPRPGSEAFPRFTMERGNSTMPPRRPSQQQQQQRRSRATSGPERSRPTHSRAPSMSAAAHHAKNTTPNLNDSATKMQVNQTYSIAMMASPVNPLPFFLPIPLGVAMLLTPQGSTRPNGPRKPSA
ncbi:hypothetical protein QBC37DRAFT_193469 [Rhypophila decipiens]|uniref:Uncharacterized protein n=1 Tax=Rhypophila decipiens TaxID=261697 RepID=A0AAN6Y6W5_9PEZI|nr:hypothetical protein QBC37DRAFT_193469 [Rhypophila decipiens]